MNSGTVTKKKWLNCMNKSVLEIGVQQLKMTGYANKIQKMLQTSGTFMVKTITKRFVTTVMNGIPSYFRFFSSHGICLSMLQFHLGLAILCSKILMKHQMTMECAFLISTWRCHGTLRTIFSFIQLKRPLKYILEMIWTLIYDK